VDDEYHKYCAEPTVSDVEQGVYWWLEPTQQKRFLNLSKMAVDILSIPSTSYSPERLFSGAKISIIDRRNRLGICTIQALECLKLWIGIFELTGDDIEDEDEFNRREKEMKDREKEADDSGDDDDGL
jgi:hypothetical protein